MSTSHNLKHYTNKKHYSTPPPVKDTHVHYIYQSAISLNVYDKGVVLCKDDKLKQVNKRPVCHSLPHWELRICHRLTNCDLLELLD